MTVYVAFLGNYTDRGTIGVYLTERLAKQALWDRPEWHAEMAALHWPFLHSGQIGPMRPWYDIECWQVGGEWVPSRAIQREHRDCLPEWEKWRAALLKVLLSKASLEARRRNYWI